MKCHLTNKFLNYDSFVGRDVLHEQGMIFNFENKTITWQEVSISMKSPNCTAKIPLQSKKVAQLGMQLNK